MKKFKRIMALVLSLILVLAMSVPAMADNTEPDNTESEEVQVAEIILRDKYKDHIYEAYQIFSGKEANGVLSDVKWGSGFRKENAETFLNALQEKKEVNGTEVSVFENVFDSITYNSANPDQLAADIANAIATKGFSHDDEFMQKFAGLLHKKNSEGAYLYLNNTMSDSEARKKKEETGTAPAITYYLSTPDPGTNTPEIDAKGNYVYRINNDGDGIPKGYYLIKDQDGSLEDRYDYYTRLLLQVVGKVDTQPKGSIPNVKKEVSSTIDNYYGQTLDSMLTSNIYFKLDGGLPDNMNKYETYEYTFHDTLSAGLDMVTEDIFYDGNGDNKDDFIHPGIVSMYIQHNDTNKTKHFITNNSDNTGENVIYLDFDQEDKSNAADRNAGFITYSHYETDQNGKLIHKADFATRELTIKFYNLLESLPNLLPDDEIIVKYAVRLNANAIIGEGKDPEKNSDYVEGETPESEKYRDPDIQKNEVPFNDLANENKVYLEFSNNPQGGGVGKTPTDDAEVFTYQLNINKYGEGDETKLLPDAYFLLSNRLSQGSSARDTDASERTELDTTYDFAYPVLKKDDEGAYVVTDWIISGDAIVQMQVEEDENGNPQKDENGNIIAYGVRKDGTLAWIKGDEEQKSILLTNHYMVSDTEKSIRLIGLNAGSYFLRELQSPVGYNTLKDAVTVSIHVEHNGTTGEIKKFEVNAQGASGSVDKENGVATIAILNTLGSTLPSTGGVGTTIFYVVGSMMVLAAVVLLITRKRMSDEN